MDQTRIDYTTTLDGWYDLENNPYQRHQMLNHAIPNNIKIFGDLNVYIEALKSKRLEAQLKVNPLLVQWFTFDQQIKFLEKVQKGEIKNEKEINQEKIQHQEGIDADAGGTVTGI